MRTILSKVLLLTAVALLAARPDLIAAGPATSSGPVLLVGVAPVSPPMIFKEGKRLTGVEVDLAQALGRELGRPIKFVERPWEDLINALGEDKIDINSTTIWHLAGMYEAQGLVVAPMALSEEMLAWAVKMSDAALRESANAFLKKARASGELNQTLRRWMPKLQ